MSNVSSSCFRLTLIVTVLVGFSVGTTQAAIVQNCHSGCGFVETNGLFTSLSVPGAVATVATGINNGGRVVGFSNGPPTFRDNGFLYNNGIFSTIAYPGALDTHPLGINASEQIVGNYVVSTSGINTLSGFVESRGSYSSIFYPGAITTSALGINAAGDIVGYSDLTPSYRTGFLDHGGVFSLVAPPGTSESVATGINNNGEIVGSYVTLGPVFFVTDGFSEIGGVYKTIVYPGADDTEPIGVNNKGQILVFASGPGVPGIQGYFVFDGNTFTALNYKYPGPTLSVVTGFNDHGQIVGYYFTTTPEPSSLAMLSAGLLPVIGVIRRRYLNR